MTPGSRPRERKAEERQIEALVKEHWLLLRESGWDFVGGALKHYESLGLEHLRQDLETKQADVTKARLAARTCVHCHTVHESPDEVEPCPRCGDPICKSRARSCRANPCFRNHGGGGHGPSARASPQRR